MTSGSYTTVNPSFDPQANYTVYGLWNFVVPPVGSFSFNPAGNYTVTGNWSFGGGFALTAITSATEANVLYYNTANGAVTYGAPPSFNPAANYTVTGNWSFGAGVNFTAVPAATTSNILFYNSTTGAISYGEPTFALSGNYTVTGAWTFNGTVTINNGTTILINTEGNIEIDGVYSYLYANTQVKVDAPTVFIGTTTATAIDIGSTSVTTLSIIGQLPSTPPLDAVNVVWSPSTKQFYYA